MNTAAEQVQVEMVHRLATVLASIHDDAVFGGESLLPGDLRSRPHQMPEQSAVILAYLVERADMFAGHNQHVHRRLGVDVGECVCELVLINGR